MKKKCICRPVKLKKNNNKNHQIPTGAVNERVFEVENAKNIINIMQADKGYSQTALKT